MKIMNELIGEIYYMFGTHFIRREDNLSSIVGKFSFLKNLKGCKVKLEGMYCTTFIYETKIKYFNVAKWKLL